MNIVWSSDAIEMADYFFEVTRHLYGQKIYQKYLDKIDTIQKQLSIIDWRRNNRCLLLSEAALRKRTQACLLSTAAALAIS